MYSLYLYKRGPIVYEPLGSWIGLELPVLVYTKLNLFDDNYIIIKINKDIDRATVIPPNNNNQNLGIERFNVVTKIYHEKVHWNLELHQPHRVHDYMRCGYRIGH